MKAIFSSNFIEVLSEKLKENLFFNHPKEISYVFVPNKFIKKHLMKEFCDDPNLEVCFDLNFVNMDNFLSFIQNKLLIPKEKRFLSFLELNLIIREKISGYIFNNDKSFKLLYKYLVKNGEILEKRFLSVCDELTESFIKYSIYGNIDDLKKKIKDRWQARLFYEIFYEDNYPLVFRDLKNFDVKILNHFHFHFFDINYIPYVYFNFIDKFLHVYHYINSFCKFFWEDVVSDFERHKINKYWQKKDVKAERIEELDSYLKDRNSLLANLGKVKKNFLKILSSYDDYQNFEYYVENDHKNKTDISFLQLVQKDILYLENRCEDDLKTLLSNDSSIQIHIATSKFREIEVLRDNIIKLIAKNKDLNLSDIHVVASNLDDYVPYVQMIFNDKDNFINYKIADGNLSKTSHLIFGIMKIFSLASSKWERNEVLDLLENPLLQKKFKITKEEKEFFFECVEKSNIYWGLDEEHIKKNLKTENEIKGLNQKTWERGFFKMISGLVFILEENYTSKSFSYDFPLQQFDMTNSLIFDKYLNIFLKLIEDLKVIEEKKALTLDEWQKYFQNIILNYFEIEDDFVENSALDACISFFDDLKNISFRFKEKCFCYDFLLHHFKNYILSKKININFNNEQAICFSSFENSQITNKIIFIIGLDDEALKLSSKSSLDLADSKEIPMKNDIKRSLFLEAILNARDNLILSFTSSSGSIFDSSIVLQELIFYLDNFYKINNQTPSKAITTYHLSFSFHESYFFNKKSFSNLNFLAAKAYYHEKEESHSKLHDNKKEFLDIIEIEHLRQLLKNPIKFYLNKVLDIYLPEEKKQNEFTFSSLDRYLIKKSSDHTDIEDILFSYDKKAKMPIGIFYEIEKNKITDEVKKYHQVLAELEIDRRKIFAIDFKQGAKKAQINENLIHMPPIEIQFENRQIKLLGKIENISNKGLLINQNAKTLNLIKMWSDFLIYQMLDGFPSKQVIFLKDRKIKKYNISDPEKFLLKLFEYYFICLKEPSFMITPFIEPIIKEDVSSLEKEIKKLYEQKEIFLDVYSKWFFSNSEKIKAENILNRWSKYIKDVFQPVSEEI